MLFKEILAFWLSESGLSEEHIQTVLAHPRMQLSLDMRDPGGVHMDLPRVLNSLPWKEVEDARERLSSPSGQFSLMVALRACQEGAPRELPKSSPAPRKFIKLVNSRLGWVHIGEERVCLLSEPEVAMLARCSMVASLTHYVTDCSDQELALGQNRMFKTFSERAAPHGFRRDKTTVLQFARGFDANSTAILEDRIELVLSLSEKSLTRFLELNSQTHAEQAISA